MAVYVRELRYKMGTQGREQAVCSYEKKRSTMISVHVHGIPFEVSNQAWLDNPVVKRKCAGSFITHSVVQC